MTPKINFNDPYKRSDFLPFLEWFLPDDFLITEKKIDNLNFTTKYTKDVTKLGECRSLELDVYEITHSSTHDARVGIAQDAFKLMLYKSYNNRALVIFKPANSNKYRFSLLQIEAEVSDNTSRITRSYSNPRRYSFQLGAGAHVKTPNQFLLEDGKLLKKDGSYFNDLESRFSVEVLTKQFYKELSDWYFWALRHVEFPSKPTYEDSVKKDKPLEEMVKEHNATNVIRLLTRLLFVWFIKQKNLIPDELFDVNELENNILTELNPVKEDGLFAEMSKDSVYYKAILQNLFFASLNCPVKPQSGDEDKRQRGFRRNKNYGDDFGNDWLFRYEKYFKDPDAFVELINSKVPFLNGGLFECLDDKANNIIIDGFSDNLKKPDRLVVPDYLFFGKDENVDLSEDYGDNSLQYKQASVKGLINILKTYNFTVEENTPAEVVVALDPELLGKVFENLLASFNPETKTTARKQTGSFYTPREIVNYMVDESLIAYLKGKTHIDEEDIRLLFQYTDEEHKLSTSQIEELINAIYDCKILDPACGSGAFPMGVLQQLVHILKKVDPENYHWKKVQNENATKEIQKALDIEDRKERENRLIEINNAFDVKKNRPDYARKLYIIENCIYGVDIQPIAIQISKLRFFISLVVDQKNKYEDENFGIIPLPNLETKFVAANTLIGINRPSGQLSLSDTVEIRNLQEELRICRHKIFSAKTIKTKRKWRKIDREKRFAIAEELKNTGWNNEDADMLAKWDPYDQNASSPFFDTEWMFGLQRESKHLNAGNAGGFFDVVLGNPPYLVLSSSDTMLKSYKERYITANQGKVNLYKLFFEKSIELVKFNGALSLITPNSYLADQSQKLRELLLNNRIIEILEYTEKNKVFENVTQAVATIVMTKGYISDNFVKIKTEKQGRHICKQEDLFKTDKLYLLPLNGIIRKMLNYELKITDVLEVYQGEINVSTNREYFSLEKMDNSLRMWRGNNIGKYYPVSQPIEWCPLNINKRTHYLQERIVFQEVSNQSQKFRTKAIISPPYFLCGHTCNYMVLKDQNDNIYYYLGLVNSKIFNYFYNYFSFTNHITVSGLKMVPLPPNDLEQNLITNLVDQILELKRGNSQADTLELENQIDVLIYKLYNLTYEEVKVVDPDFYLTEEEYVSQ